MNLIKNLFFIFIFLSPLYYFSFLFIDDIYDEQYSNMRQYKDFLLFFLLIFSLFFIFLKAKFFIKKTSLILISLIFVFGLYKILILGEILRYDFIRFFIFGPIIFFVTSNFLKNYDSVYKIINYLIFISFIVSLIGLFEFFYVDSNKVYSKAAGVKRVASTLFSPNALSWYLVLINTLILSQLFFKKNVNFYLLFLLILNFFIIILTGSRGGFLFSILSCFMHFIFSNRKHRLSALYFFVLLSPIILYLINFTSIFDGRATESLDTSRLFLFSNVFSKIWDLPIQDLLFGLSKNDLRLLLELELLDDSFILSLIVICGIFGFLFIICILIILTFVNKLNFKSPISLTLLMALLMSIGGNLLLIFPHSILFWFLLSLNEYLNKNNALHNNFIITND